MALEVKTPELSIPGMKKPTEFQRVWLQSTASALSGGATGEHAVVYADEVALAYTARFGVRTDDLIGGTVELVTALKYYERSALMGKEVVLNGCVDSPPVGVIRDFVDGAVPTVKVEWVTGCISEGVVHNWLSPWQLRLTEHWAG